jgi:tetratricopeptide (TPR) repeat protein
LGGSKVFRYVLVPDSVGSAAVAPVSYSYFDPVLRSYQRSEIAGLALVVAPRAEGSGSRAVPPALMLDGSPSLAWSLRHGSPAVWWLVALLPPSLLLLRRIPRPRRRTAPKSRTVDSLAELERALEDIIAPLVPVAATERELISALRRAGISPEDASTLLSLRERVRAARFGQGDLRSAAMLAEAAPVLARLAGRRTRLGPRWRSVAAMALVSVALPGRGSQGPSPEQLYRDGALAAAASGFAQRTQLDPAVAANWYNLGAARFRLGQDQAALADWTQAARLLPRDATIRRALTLTPSADHGSARWLWVSPVTPEELWLLAAASWIVGWIGLFGSGRLRGRWLVLVTAGGLLGVGAGTLDYWYHRPVAVSRGGEALRLSPHELAPVVGDLAQGSAVHLIERRPGWLFVEDAGGRRGWMLAESAVPVGPLN